MINIYNPTIFSNVLLLVLISLFIISCHHIPIIDWKRDSYRVSCPPEINKNALKDQDGVFIFTLHVGDAGSCPSDRDNYKDNYIEFAHSERQEINWPLNIGTTVFMTEFRVDGAPSYRNTFFQIHDGSNSGPPPTYIGLDEHFNIRVAGKRSNGESYYLTLSRYRLEEGYDHNFCSLITYDGNILDIEYYIDQNLVFAYVNSHIQVNNTPYPGYPMMKIGQYRIIPQGTTIFTYTNLNVDHALNYELLLSKC